MELENTPIEDIHSVPIRQLDDGILRIATWNLNNGFTVEAISRVMIRGNISILFVQEPKKLFDEVDVAFTSRKLVSYGLKGYFAEFQYIIYNQMKKFEKINLKMTNGTPNHHQYYHSCHTTLINSIFTTHLKKHMGRITLELHWLSSPWTTRNRP